MPNRANARRLLDFFAMTVNERLRSSSRFLGGGLVAKNVDLQLAMVDLQLWELRKLTSAGGAVAKFVEA